MVKVASHLNRCMLSLQAYDARQAQLTMDNFLSFNERFAKIKSKRLAKAVRGISKTANPHMLLADADDEPVTKRKRGRKQASPAQAGVHVTAAPRSSAASTSQDGRILFGASRDVSNTMLNDPVINKPGYLLSGASPDMAIASGALQARDVTIGQVLKGYYAVRQS